MKSTILKLVLGFGLIAGLSLTSSAHGRYERRSCERHYYRPAPRAYYVPRPHFVPRYAPVAYYRPVWVPAHWAINPYGYRVWVQGCYR